MAFFLIVAAFMSSFCTKLNICFCVQDWCSAGQVVLLSGPAGLLLRPMGQYGGYPHGPTARLHLHRHSLWPHDTAGPTDAHVRLRPPCSGEFLRSSVCQHRLKDFLKFPRLSPGEANLSCSARFKRFGPEEHAWSAALLFPLCHMPCRYPYYTHCLVVQAESRLYKV